MFRPVLVEESLRSGLSRRATVSIGGKMLTTPFYGTILQKKLEMDFLCDNSHAAGQNFQMVILKLHQAGNVIRERQGSVGQMTLFGASSEGDYEHLRSSKVWSVDPCTDEYPYVGIEREGLETFSGFSTDTQRMIRSYTTENHSVKWQDLHGDASKFMRFIRENIVASHMLGSDYVIPPVPLIRADDPTYMVDIWYDVIRTTGTYAKSTLEKSSSIFLNLHYNNFRRPEKLKIILKRLQNEVVETEIADIKLVILKTRNNQLEEDSSAERYNFKKFIIALSKYAEQTGRAFFLLNTDSLGLASISLGCDGYVEPLNGVLGGVARSKTKKGRYYHPEGLKFMSYRPHVHDLYNNSGGTLPCVCTYCQTINGRHLATVGDKEWNIMRRGHLLAKRSEEINESYTEIQNNTISTSIHDKIARSDRKNLLDILLNGP